MKKILLLAAFSLLFCFAFSTDAFSQTTQTKRVVRKTNNGLHKGWYKGKRVGQKTWRKGKRVSLKSYGKGKRITYKGITKTKEGTKVGIDKIKIPS